VKRLRVSATASIASALVIKDGGVFFLCKPDGQVPLGGEHGFGLYYHDCRFLNGYELRIAHAELDLLASTAVGGFTASVELTNTDIESDEQTIEKEQVGIRLNRTADGGDLLLQDDVAFTNVADFGARSSHIGGGTAAGECGLNDQQNKGVAWHTDLQAECRLKEGLAFAGDSYRIGAVRRGPWPALSFVDGGRQVVALALGPDFLYARPRQ
jgi:hypothetical protein